MILDSLAVFGDAVTATLSGAATDVIDQGASADAYASNWLNIRIDTAYAVITGTPTNQFELQTASTTDFLEPDAITLAASALFLYTDLTAGKYVWQIRIPKGIKRYIRVYKKTVTSGGSNYFFNAGAYDAFITKDIDMNTVKVRA